MRYVLGIFVFIVVLILSCNEKRGENIVENGVEIFLEDGFFNCVSINGDKGQVKYAFIEIPFSMKSQNSTPLPIAIFIKAIKGSFKSYIENHIIKHDEWETIFTTPPSKKEIEQWANNPTLVANFLKNDENTMKEARIRSKATGKSPEQMINEVSQWLSGQVPKYKFLQCVATVTVIDNKFSIKCYSNEGDLTKFSVYKTPLTPLYDKYANISIMAASVCAN